MAKKKKQSVEALDKKFKKTIAKYPVKEAQGKYMNKYESGAQ